MTGPRRRPAGRRGDRGQSTVEFALALPFLVLVLAVVVQVGVVAYRQVLVTHAAREAARTAAVTADPGAPRAAAAASAGLDARYVEVEVTPRGAPGTTVTARVVYHQALVLPFVGAVGPVLALQAAATMRVEG